MISRDIDAVHKNIDKIDYHTALRHYKNLLWKLGPSPVLGEHRKSLDKAYMKLLLFKKLERAGKTDERKLLAQYIEEIFHLANAIGKDPTPLIRMASQRYEELVRKHNKLEIKENRF